MHNQAEIHLKFNHGLLNVMVKLNIVEFPIIINIRYNQGNKYYLKITPENYKTP
jgi:hypothetical protein